MPCPLLMYYRGMNVIRFEDTDAPNIIQQVVAVLKQEKLAILPTDTVYGVMALATGEEAIKRLYRAKGRDPRKPTALLVSSLEMAKEYIGNDLVSKLGKRFWPGPLTIIKEAKIKIGSWPKLGIRVPDELFLLQVLEKVGEPLLASSANLAGEKPPTDLSQVSSELAEQVDIAVDKGSTKLKAESTIIEITGNSFKIMRSGSVSENQIKQALN